MEFSILLLELCCLVLIPIHILTIQLHCYIIHVCHLLHGCFICLWKVFQILLKKPSFHYPHYWRHLLRKECNHWFLQRAVAGISTIVIIWCSNVTELWKYVWEIKRNNKLIITWKIERKVYRNLKHSFCRLCLIEK